MFKNPYFFAFCQRRPLTALACAAGVLATSVGAQTPQVTALSKDVVADVVTTDSAATTDSSVADAANGAVAASFVCQEQGKVCTQSDTHLPAQVLPRAFSQLYRAPQRTEDNLLPQAIPAFVPLYVFNQQASPQSDSAAVSWYQVGQNLQTPLGWLSAKDAIPWKQALVVSYTHPGDESEGRNPLLMFKSVQALEAVLDSEQVEEDAEKIYLQIEDGQTPPAVVSIEPKQFIDIRDKLYFLPITAWKATEVDGEDIKLLKIVAAVPNARGATTLDNKAFMQAAKQSRTYTKRWGQAGCDDASDTANGCVNDGQPSVDIVFVVDTTLSMQPYINRTRDLIRRVANKIEDSLPEVVKFSVVGYRDSTAYMPKIGYTAKPFSEHFINAAALANQLNGVKATKVNSDDEAEEVFAGIEAAVNAPWRSQDFRFIVLIGDASGHDRDHPYNTTGSNHEDVKQLLEQEKIHLIAIHLQSKRKAALKDRPIATLQYEYLSNETAMRHSAFIPVNTHKPQDFDAAVDTIVSVFTGRYAQLNQQSTPDTIGDAAGDSVYDDSGADPSSPNLAPDVAVPAVDTATAIDSVAADNNIDNGADDGGDTMADAVTSLSSGNSLDGNSGNAVQDAAFTAASKVFQAALIEYIGQAATPPNDIAAWVADRDLVDLGFKSLNVHILLTKNQLSTLEQSLKRVLQAVKTADASQADFFTSLQQIAGQTVNNPAQIAAANTLAETGLLPTFIQRLPYKSQVLSLTDEMFASMTSSQRQALESEIKARIRQYRDIIATPDLWKHTNPDDPDSVAVYPLPLSLLP